MVGIGKSSDNSSANLSSKPTRLTCRSPDTQRIVMVFHHMRPSIRILGLDGSCGAREFVGLIAPDGPTGTLSPREQLQVWTRD